MGRRRKDENCNRIFIVGIIYGKNTKCNDRVEAVKLYDRQTGKSEIQSIEKVMQRIKNKEPIVGVRIKTSTRYSEKVHEFIDMEQPYFDIMKYDYRLIDVIDGNENILKSGTEIIVGTKTINGEEMCGIINSRCELRFISKSEAIKGQYLGVVRGTLYRESSEPIEQSS